jgi:predicted RND superfamily exporter protein
LQVVVLLITAVLLGIGIYGTLQLEVKFDYVEFLPQDSGLYKWFTAKEKHYPEEGEMGIIYFAEFDLRR